MIGKIILYFIVCILVTVGLQRLAPVFTLFYLVVCLAALIVGGVAIVVSHRDHSAREELRQLRDRGTASPDRR